MAGVTEKQRALPGIASLAFIGGYFGLTFARSAGWIPESWSLIPVVETAWLNFLVVLAAIIWMRVRKIPLSHVGLGALRPLRSLFMWVVGTMAIDSLAIGIATPALTSAFGEAQQVARFDDVPGNLPLLVMLLPFTWLIGIMRIFVSLKLLIVLNESHNVWHQRAENQCYRATRANPLRLCCMPWLGARLNFRPCLPHVIPILLSCHSQK